MIVRCLVFRKFDFGPIVSHTVKEINGINEEQRNQSIPHSRFISSVAEELVQHARHAAGTLEKEPGYHTLSKACDIVDFPKVRVRFISGKDLIEKYPGKRCKVPFAERESFFTVDNG